jgi:hypothetical protein
LIRSTAIALKRHLNPVSYFFSEQILYAKWMDSLLVYNKLSGDTHCFEGTAKDLVFFCYLNKNFDLSDIVQAFEISFPNIYEADDFIKSLINNLIAINLIMQDKNIKVG